MKHFLQVKHCYLWSNAGALRRELPAFNEPWNALKRRTYNMWRMYFQLLIQSSTARSERLFWPIYQCGYEHVHLTRSWREPPFFIHLIIKVRLLYWVFMEYPAIQLYGIADSIGIESMKPVYFLSCTNNYYNLNVRIAVLNADQEEGYVLHATKIIWPSFLWCVT